MFMSDEGDEPLVVTALLVKVHLKPKCQVFADCGLLGEGVSPQRVFRLPEAPFSLRIMMRPSRMGRPTGRLSVWNAIALSTSDELAKFLLSLRPAWQLFEVKYSLDDDDSLLQMKAVERGAEIVARARPARRRASDFAYPEELDVPRYVEKTRSPPNTDNFA